MRILSPALPRFRHRDPAESIIFDAPGSDIHRPRRPGFVGMSPGRVRRHRLTRWFPPQSPAWQIFPLALLVLWTLIALLRAA